MRFDFLEQFPKRMKIAGIYSIFIKNGIQKETWKQYGFLTIEEQINLIFALLLYIMEQSLKEEICTINDIGNFLDELNMTYWKKGLSYEGCKKLGDFIINVILANEGKPMYFQGFNFETGEYERIHISYISNRIVYLEQDIKRTSYFLTDDGYNLILSTLEIEGNLKLTMHEMVFKLHLEKATYDKAAEEMKNVFHMMRMQLQKIQDAMYKIKQNALRYSVQNYRELLEGNLNTIEDTKKRFLLYRKKVIERVKEIEEKNIQLEKLEKKDLENLEYLKVINDLLNRALDEHQRILSFHFDLKALYTRELESMAKMASVKRFNLQNDFYEFILNDSVLLERVDYFLRPLFQRKIEKTYNINLAFQRQIPLRKQKKEEEEEFLFEEEWEKEQEKERIKKIQNYSDCVEEIIKNTLTKTSVTLQQIKELADIEKLIPSVGIFKEVLIEFIKSKEIELESLKKEQEKHLEENTIEFELNIILLTLIQKKEYQNITKIKIEQIKEETVVFENIVTNTARRKKIYCSNIRFQIKREGDEEEYGI